MRSTADSGRDPPELKVGPSFRQPKSLPSLAVPPHPPNIVFLAFTIIKTIDNFNLGIHFLNFSKVFDRIKKFYLALYPNTQAPRNRNTSILKTEKIIPKKLKNQGIFFVTLMNVHKL